MQGNEQVDYDPPLRGREGMAATQGGRSPTEVAAMPRKLESFGLASYKKLRATLAKLLCRQPARRGFTRVTKLYRHRRPVLIKAAGTSTLNLDDFWPRSATTARWALVPLQDELLDQDAYRRLKLWLEN